MSLTPCGSLWVLSAPEPVAALLISSCVNTTAQRVPVGSPSWHLLTIFHYCLAGENILLLQASHKTTFFFLERFFWTKRGSGGDLRAKSRLSLWQGYPASRPLPGCPFPSRLHPLGRLAGTQLLRLWPSLPTSKPSFGANGHL